MVNRLIVFFLMLTTMCFSQTNRLQYDGFYILQTNIYCTNYYYLFNTNFSLENTGYHYSLTNYGLLFVNGINTNKLLPAVLDSSNNICAYLDAPNGFIHYEK